MFGGAGVPPGFAGEGGGVGGFGDVGQAKLSYGQIVKGAARMKETEENVEHDAVNCLLGDFRATGAMLEQEHLRFINLFAATGNGGVSAGSLKYPKGIMEHKVTQSLIGACGHKSLFRLWHQKFATALGHVGVSHELLVHRFVKETDFGKEMDKFATGPRANYGDEFDKISGDAWNILIDKAEMEAHDKIKMAPKWQGVVAYGVMYR